MSAPKTFSSVRADAETSAADGNRRTGRVEMRALPDWLKTDRLVTASLSPKRARQLAIELLTAAEKAEAGSMW